MLIDARGLPADSAFECDLCVVGAGPAGLAIVDRLRGAGLAVMLLESGGFDLELSTQKLYRGEIRGDDYFRLDACRWRLFGGSTNRWGGWCRPLEPVDFTQRDWVPHSGWPIDAQSLARYHADAAQLFELTSARFDLAAWRDRLPAPYPLEPGNFSNEVFQFSPETNFGERYRARVLAAENITTMIHANLTSIRLDPGSNRVGSLAIATLTGRSVTIRPKAVVLACGGIENARLLLASNADRSAGLGNEFDLVGRHFMEHLHVPFGHLVAAPSAAGSRFYRKEFYGDARLRGVITPTAVAQTRHRLLGTSIAIDPPRYAFGTPFVGWAPPLTFGVVRRYRHMRQGRFKKMAENLRQFAENLHGLPIKHRTLRLARSARSRMPSATSLDRVHSLYFRAEQAPDPGNRVVLSARRDRLGMPETRLEWRIGSSDTGSMRAWLDLFGQEVRRTGIGDVVEPQAGWEAGIIGGPHHMGTTRMSSAPRRGVVDAECRVHSVANLYVAGSSVFATGGYTNPTFSLVTLALRLADTLRNRLLEPSSLRAVTTR